MSKRDDDDESIKALQRMIAYIREEALRLRIGDVAHLLERAEDAVAGSAPTGSRDHESVWFQDPAGSILEH